MRTRLAPSIAALATVLALDAHAQLARVGPEFQVNTYTTSSQSGPSIASDASGNFVLTWTSQGQDGDTFGIFGRRYDNGGAPVSSEFQVNIYTTGSQTAPRLALDGTGNFVVVWQGYDYASSAGVFGRRYDAAGVPLGAEFQVNTYTPGAQRFPGVASAPSGSFVVAWNDQSLDGYSGIFARRYDSSGAPLDPMEFQVNSYTTDSQTRPALAVDGAGNFTVAWSSEGQDADFSGIFARRFDSNGSPLTPEFQVNVYTTGAQSLPAVESDAAGGFVVAWRSPQDGNLLGVIARRFDDVGVPLGGEFQVNQYFTGVQFPGTIAMNSLGEFVIVWGSRPQDGDDLGVFARRYSAGGTPLGGEFQVNTFTTDNQAGPTVASDDAGNFVVTWQSGPVGPGPGQDGDLNGVFAQRFKPAGVILGKKILVKDSSGAEANRQVIALAKESSTDIGMSIVGDPTVSGATLRVIANGTTDSDQVYVLDAAGWSPLGTLGFKYQGPTGGDGDPVKRVLLKRTQGGTALLKAIIKGSLGTQSLDVVPPNAGDEGGIVLAINGGRAYCAQFGGSANGTETTDTDKLWKIINATAQPGCPITPTTTTVTSTTSTSTIP